MTKPVAREDRKSVLNRLTADVMAEKKGAAKALTPVEGEVPQAKPEVLPRAKVPFPNDHPQEVVEQKAAELTRIIADLTEARDALLSVLDQKPPAEVVDLDAKRREKEAEADARVAEDTANGEDFNSKFAAMQKAAQAAVFKEVSQPEPENSDETIVPQDAPVPDEAEQAPIAEQWVCPDHGKAIEKVSPKTNKPYRGCPDCNKFER